jgi:DNA-binding transcriptional regulator PaaX
VVAYDIPDDNKKARDYFRQKLELLGFIKIQESLFSFPYECKQEIAVFAQSLGIAPFVMYMQTNRIPFESRYLKSFGLNR